MTPRAGRAVRARRKEVGLTLARVASLSGLSAPFLSQVENDRARPSITSLQRIADALGTTAAQLLAASETGAEVDVVRADEASPLDAARGSRVRPLVRGARQLHAMEFTGGEHGDGTFVHRNDELMYVVHGSARAVADGEEHLLAAGDTLYCAGGTAHNWSPLTADTRVLLVAVSDSVRTTHDG